MSKYLFPLTGCMYLINSVQLEISNICGIKDIILMSVYSSTGSVTW